MKTLYNIGIHFYSTGVRIAGFFGNKKAKKWIFGRENWRESFKKQLKNNKETIWIHATSLGEFEQVKPLIEKIKADKVFSNFKIVVTFFSPSGFEYSKNYELADYKFYLPSDTKKNVADFIKLINPTIAIFVKYDFWFNYLTVLQQNKIPHLFFGCNFRENQIYFKPGNKWQLEILRKINHLFTLNTSSLGVLQKHNFLNASVCGDTRFDKVIQNAKRCQPISLIEQFKQKKKLLILGSSWEKEETILNDYLALNKDWSKFIKIIIAPHNIYEAHVLEIIKNLPVQSLKFSEANTQNILTNDILIIDNIGMLSNLYQYSDIAFIGGGFTNRLHNILEAATFSNAILFGNSHSKFPEGKKLVDAGGGLDLFDAGSFEEYLNSFLLNDKFLETVKKKAATFIDANKGATDIVFKKVKELMPT